MSAAPGTSHRSSAARAASCAGAIATVTAVGIAVRWGAFVAGGSDSYCYLGQARMWLDGSLFAPVAPGFDPPWPNAVSSFAPTGFVPSTTVPGGIAPICAPGLSLVMAGATLLGGSAGPLAIVPLCAGVIAWCAFVLARRLAGAGAAALASGLAVLSPIVLYQAVQPMSDVPAAAAWLAALAVVAGAHPRTDGTWWVPNWMALTGGAITGLAVMIRPNLVPLAAPVAVLAWFAPASGTPARERAQLLFWLIVGALPGVLAVAALNDALYGSPLRSGYGDPGQLFSAAHVGPNLARYSRWLVQTHTPWVLLGLVSPLVLGLGSRAIARGRGASPRTLALACLGVVAALLIVYLPYGVFDDWWYLRFLLPGVVLLVVMASAVTTVLLRPLPATARFAVGVLIAAVLGTMFVRTARERHAFDLRASEARFVEAATWIRDHLPPQAVVLTIWHSGSVRFYAGRFTIAWDALPPDGLETATSYLAGIGRPPYILLDAWEVPSFRSHFSPSGHLATLEWPPRARIGHEVTLFDPADAARYHRGESVVTERVWTAAERRRR